MRRGSRPGWCVTELLAMILILCGLLAVAVPVLGRMRGVSQIDVSISNLTVLSQASSMYAADWNGRQYTNVNDELSSYGSSVGLCRVELRDRAWRPSARPARLGAIRTRNHRTLGLLDGFRGQLESSAAN